MFLAVGLYTAFFFCNKIFYLIFLTTRKILVYKLKFKKKVNLVQYHAADY